MSHDSPVTVVGGGTAGLSAAHLLCQVGHDPGRIRIVEREERLGGHVRTLYAFADAEGEPRLVTDYDLELRDGQAPLVRPRTPSEAFLSRFPEGKADLGGLQLLPCDVGFTVFTDEYRNFQALMDACGRPMLQDESLHSGLRRRYQLRDGTVLETYRFLFGLWRTPVQGMALLPELLELWWLARRFIPRVSKDDLASETVASLLARTHETHTLFGSLTRAMVSLYTGVSEPALMRMSARYFVDFLRLSDLPGHFDDVATNRWGNATTIEALRADVEALGVRLEVGDAIDPASCPGPVVVTAAPWRAPGPAGDFFDHVTVPVYVNTRPWGPKGADVHYRDTDGCSYAAIDASRYRRRYPELGVWLTFGVAGEDGRYEELLREEGRARGVDVSIRSVDEYRGEPLTTSPVKLTWEHAWVTPRFERARAVLQAWQGRGDRWYAGAPLLGSARHEDAVTTAVDAVALMKGPRALERLREKGFRSSWTDRELRARWSGAEPSLAPDGGVHHA